MTNKVLAYLGFCVKAGKVIYGISLIEQSRKPVYLLLLCHTAAENTAEKARRLAEKSKTDLLLFKTGRVEDAVNKLNCKLAAITDSGLARAIVEHADAENFELVKGGALNG